MKNLLLIFLIFCSIEVIGQNHLFGIRDGINWSNLTNNKNSKSKMNIYSGITYEYLKESNFSFGAELILNRRGAFSNDDIYDWSGENKGRHSVKYNFDYVSIPLKVGYYFGENFFGLINGGVIPSYLINAKIKFPKIQQSNFGPETFVVTQYCSKLDVSGFAEIGGGYKFDDGFSLFVSFTYLQSVNSYTRQTFERHTGKILSFGVKYSLPEK